MILNVKVLKYSIPTQDDTHIYLAINQLTNQKKNPPKKTLSIFAYLQKHIQNPHKHSSIDSIQPRFP